MSATPRISFAPTIRLFHPEPDLATPKNTRILNPGVLWGDNLGRTDTLRDWFNSALRPGIARDQARTLEGFENALQHWEARTGNRPAGDVTDDDARALRRSMEDAGLSPETTRKVWRYLSSILRAAKKKGALDELPTIGRLDSVSNEIRVVSDRELDALYRACESATWPKADGVAAADWWRCAIVLLRLYGQRWGELTTLPWRGEAKRSGETPPGIHDAPECPQSRLRTLGLACPHGWLVYTPAKQRRHKPAPLCLPLHRVARFHLDKIRGERPTVLPLTKANKSLHEQWTRLLNEAGIPESERFTRHDLRRTCETVYDEHCGGIGARITGHAARSVSDRFYSSYARRICKAVRKVPLPPSFLAAAGVDPKQKRLF